MAKVEAGLKYIDTHEWLKTEGNTGVVGLTDTAQEMLGDIVYIELPKVGDTIATHKSIGVVESVKAASEIYSPVSGKVVEINAEVVSDPALINQDCYGAAWLYKVELSHPEEVDALLDASGYENLVNK